MSASGLHMSSTCQIDANSTTLSVQLRWHAACSDHAIMRGTSARAPKNDVNNWAPENFLKGKVAETLVRELLTRSGHSVYHFGYETTLQNLTQGEKQFDRATETGQQISSLPDFVIINNANKPFFVEVKFRRVVKHGVEDLVSRLKTIEKFWRAKVILVTPQTPCFRVANPPYLDNHGKPVFVDITEDADLNITRDDLEEFERLLEKYFA